MGYKSVGKFEVQEIIDLINAPQSSAILAGFKISVSGGRLKNFAINGTDCICCGAKGAYFSVETTNKDPNTGLHLNLYAINQYGDPVLMTKDHKVLKSLGGDDKVENYSPMCLRCNNLRGNKYVNQQDFLDAFHSGKALIGNNGGTRNVHDTLADPNSKRQIALKKKAERNMVDKINHKAHVYSYFKNVKYSNLAETI